MQKSTSNHYSNYIPLDGNFSDCYEQFTLESPPKFGPDFPPIKILKFDLLRDSPIPSAELDRSSSSFFANDEKFFNNQMLAFANNHSHSELPTSFDLSFQTQFPDEEGSVYMSDEEDQYQKESIGNIEIGIKLESTLISPPKRSPTQDRPQFNSPNSIKNLEIETKEFHTSSSFRKDDLSTAHNSPLSINQLSDIELKVDLLKFRQAKYPNRAKFTAYQPKMFVKMNQNKQSVLCNKSRKISKKSSNKPRKIFEKNKTCSNHKPNQQIRLTRKIVKNFGKAIAAFACSANAKPFIMAALDNNPKRYAQFLQFVYEMKDTIEGNRRLKLLLQMHPEDNLCLRQNKMIFKALAENFMNGHVYKWLWNSHVENKNLHAKLIEQVRLRIHNPELLDQLTN